MIPLTQYFDCPCGAENEIEARDLFGSEHEMTCGGCGGTMTVYVTVEVSVSVGGVVPAGGEEA